MERSCLRKKCVHLVVIIRIGVSKALDREEKGAIGNFSVRINCGRHSFAAVPFLDQSIVLRAESVGIRLVQLVYRFDFFIDVISSERMDIKDRHCNIQHERQCDDHTDKSK